MIWLHASKQDADIEKRMLNDYAAAFVATVHWLERGYVVRLRGRQGSKFKEESKP